MPRHALFLLALVAILAAGEVAVLENLPYRNGGDDYQRARCTLDLYLPAGTKGFPVLVWFHGGGLEGGSKASKETKALAQRFAADGIAVASAGYRLSPKVTAPAYLEDAAAAVAWVSRHIAEQGGDPRALFVAGHSAGGYLAAMLAADPRFLAATGLAPDAIAGVIPVSGQVFTHFTIRKERGVADPQQTPVIDEFAPAYHVAKAKTMPPLLLICGDRDWPARVEENRYFLAMLTHCGATTAAYREFADRDHASIIGRMPQDGDPVRQAMIDFIATRRSTAAP